MALATAETHSELPQSEADESPLIFDEAVPKFVDYIASYRSYSPSTVGAYRRDLQLLREFFGVLPVSVPPGMRLFILRRLGLEGAFGLAR